MKHLPSLSKFLQRISHFSASHAGFTMIELLVVIAILGILAVAVLSAINPIEQINRGRDTSTRSDAEQLYNAIDRFNAFQRYFPWDQGPEALPTALNWVLVDMDWNAQASSCGVLAKLSDGDARDQDCPSFSGTDEVKPAFVNRVGNLGDQWGLYAFKQDGTGSTSLYLCFRPQSGAFRNEARERCEGNLPTDFPAQACADQDDLYICLP
jgi:prepilin-type N-terminal cleavage/methylation domain-containing protein